MPEMDRRFAFAAAGYCIAFVMEARSHRKTHKKLKETVEDYNTLADAYNINLVKMRHLVEIIERNEVPLTEWDAIVLNSNIPMPVVEE